MYKLVRKHGRSIVALVLMAGLFSDPALAKIHHQWTDSLVPTLTQKELAFDQQAFSQRLANFNDRLPRLAEFTILLGSLLAAGMPHVKAQTPQENHQMSDTKVAGKENHFHPRHADAPLTAVALEDSIRGMAEGRPVSQADIMVKALALNRYMQEQGLYDIRRLDATYGLNLEYFITNLSALASPAIQLPTDQHRHFKAQIQRMYDLGLEDSMETQGHAHVALFTSYPDIEQTMLESLIAHRNYVVLYHTWETTQDRKLTLLGNPGNEQTITIARQALEFRAIGFYGTPGQLNYMQLRNGDIFLVMTMTSLADESTRLWSQQIEQLFPIPSRFSTGGSPGIPAPRQPFPNQPIGLISDVIPDAQPLAVSMNRHGKRYVFYERVGYFGIDTDRYWHDERPMTPDEIFEFTKAVEKGRRSHKRNPAWQWMAEQVKKSAAASRHHNDRKKELRKAA